MRPIIRVRVALISGGTFLILGTLFLVFVYFLVRANLQARPSTTIHPDTIGATAPCDPETGRCGPYGPNTYIYKVANHRAVQVRKAYQLDTTHAVWSVGSIALGGGTVVATAGGWLLAGWGLRPIRRVTDKARLVAQSHNLTDRLSYGGPRDEIKELADTFDTMLGRLTRAFDGQRRFVANASHELRTPLAINRTLVDVALRRSDATADVRHLGESLLVVNTRHERLIDGLLALAEGEHTILDRRPLDLKDVVEHVLDQAAGKAEEHDVTVHQLLDPAPTAGDAVLLERLAQNLVENAIQHNQKGGEMWVTTRQRADRAELVVANTGLIVQAYEIETIFEPFRRLHGDRVRSDRGSGLGMSIVRAIADAHSGIVEARPREEGGLTVTVELPGESHRS
jgi:signal transduction histidine kinase